MSEPRWTVEQEAAIKTRDCNLLVAAAAGAGKTAVLVERIIQMITSSKDSFDIDNLLIVTFTNAAAAEMRERISGAVSKALEENPESNKLRRQLTLLNKASITTIHSFCLEVIRSNFQKISIDPGFRIADETEALLLKLEILQELFEDMYEETDSKQEFFDLLECYSGNRDDQPLQNMVLNLYDFIQSSPRPEEWLKETTDKLKCYAIQDIADTEWGKELINSAYLELQGLKKIMERALAVIETDPELESYYEVFQNEAAEIDKLLELCITEKPAKWDTLYGKLNNFCFEKLPRAGKECNPAQRDYVKDLRDSVKKRIGDLSKKVIGSDTEDIRKDLQIIYPLMKCLSDLVREFSARYSALKNTKAIVDFNDLEHLCLEILTVHDEKGQIWPSDIALSYRQRFREIMVDEYQDSNDVQETIIRMISRADEGTPNVFMVGDVKQSIYRFRQAKPELFQEKYESYPEIIWQEGNISKEKLSQAAKDSFKILLSKNFRSRKEIVDAVNFIFRQIMSKNVGELNYTEKEALNSGADYPLPDNPKAVTGGEVEIHLLQTMLYDNDIKEKTDSSSDDDSQSTQDLDESIVEESEIPDNIQGEARLAARRIRELMQPDQEGRVFHVMDKESKKYRRVEYRDIVVLLRTTRNWAEIFMEEFASQGIPAFADTGSGFFKSIEIRVILSLLQIIDNSFQDIPLLSVLRSPIVSLSTDELAELRLAERKVPLFDALQTLAKTGTSPLAEKLRGFVEDLERWRDMSVYMSIDQLLWQLYEETGYYSAVGAMPAGQQRQANLRILFERARQFEETSFKGLFNFIYFIDKLKTGKGDLGSARILGEKDNVVRLMSIHKSKGLEFPVVILAGCGKKFNLQDMNKNILLHYQLGFGPDVVDYRSRMAYPSIPKLAIREKIRRETMSEEMRILYVALTRAKEKLILTGTVKEAPKVLAKWAKCSDGESKLPDYEMIKANNYLDWIGPAVLRHNAFRELSAYYKINETSRYLEDPSIWQLKIWSKSEFANGEEQEEKAGNEFFDWLQELSELCEDQPREADRFTSSVAEYPDDAGSPESQHGDCLIKEITRRLSWDYPFGKLVQVPVKITVTELKRRFENVTEEAGLLVESAESIPLLIKKPLFLQAQKGLSAAEAGTVMHFVMQHLDPKDNNIEGQIARMVAKDMLTVEQSRAIKTERIREFLTSDLGRRMLASPIVYKETPFNIEISCREIFQELNNESYDRETVLLQGVIDCYFEEADGIVLVDYKTDYVTDGKEEAIKERYRRQIFYYARALEVLTGKQVKEKYIYLFSNGKALKY